jgi:hypothetical protein
MADWPLGRLSPPPLMGWWSVGAMGAKMGGLAELPSVTAAASAAYTQNRAYIFPFRLFDIARPLKMCWIVGATANGNIDAGIYDSEKNRIASTGAVAQGAINTFQAEDLTATPNLLPGDYFMAISGSSATGTLFRGTTTDELTMPGNLKYIMASAHALPATISLTKDSDGSPIWPLLAIAFDTFY